MSIEDEAVAAMFSECSRQNLENFEEDFHGFMATPQAMKDSDDGTVSAFCAYAAHKFVGIPFGVDPMDTTKGETFARCVNAFGMLAVAVREIERLRALVRNLQKEPSDG